jgi:hypothetical protein
MQARSPEQVIADIQSIADKALERHEILEDVEVNDQEGYWLVGRPKDSAYRVQISVLKFGVLHVHGDVGPAMWGHFYDKRVNRLSVLRWMAKRPTHDSYMAEKAARAMGGRKHIMDREDDVALWEAQQHLEAITREVDEQYRDEHERAEVAMWHHVCSMIESGMHDLFEVDRYIYETCHDPELCGLGEMINGNVMWSHFLVRKLWALLQQKGIVE